jgi:hypothetical protein
MRVFPALLIFGVCLRGPLMGASIDELSPQPPCSMEPNPPYPDLEHSPSFKVWDRASLGREWKAPGCIGWTASGFATLVTTVARFRHSTGVEGLLSRVAAISRLTGIRYWSTTRQQWKPLIVNASALEGASASQRRQDFPTADLVTGAMLYFQQSDSLTGKATYRLHILSVSQDRLVYETENITALRYLMVPIFPPHELQAIYFLDRESPDIWRYYSIARTGKNANGLATGHDASTVNRAVAFFRYLASIPTDQEPPAAR